MNTYEGRKIRTEEKPQQETPKTSPKEIAKDSTTWSIASPKEIAKDSTTWSIASPKEIPKVSTTWSIASSKGILKPGMVVCFEGGVFQSILDNEMTGKKQKVEYELSKGVVLKNGNEKFSIFAVIRITSGLVLRGRYGRAEGYQTVNYLAKGISENIKKCNSHLLTVQEFLQLCLWEENYLIFDYLRKSSIISQDVVFSINGKLACVNLEEFRYTTIEIEPGNKEYQIYNIGIELKVNECALKKGNPKTINCMNSFFDNPNEWGIEVNYGL